jgi:hypothetical protein
MDILAHTLWAGAGIAWWRRRLPAAPRTVVLTLGLAALPDLPHLLPILGWRVAGSGSFDVLRAYALAVPEQAPALPALVQLFSHHLHCVTHSAVVAGGVTLLVWKLRGALWIPLLGWWSHIVIDVFTHSADYYASPVLYPFTQRGFDGIAWNTAWFMALNYMALAGVSVWLLVTRTRGPASACTPANVDPRGHRRS